MLKIGIIKPKTDLAIKHIAFIADGKKHFISFRFSHLKGIKDDRFDGQEVKVTDTYPPLIRLVWECVSVIVQNLNILIIGEKGINLTAVSKRTGVPYMALYNSLANKRSKRELKGKELVLICKFLDINPMDFVNSKNTTKGVEKTT